MCKLIVVSNRRLAANFAERIQEITALEIPVILREKDLNETEYQALAEKMLKISDRILLHTYSSVAKKLGYGRIHLPLRILESSDLQGFTTVGASVHSVEEAIRAQELGVHYITAGHVFQTDCKKGVPPRGLKFLKDVCAAVEIPVYAIGGITPENTPSALECGAAGVCAMSSFMTAPDVGALYRKFPK